MVLSVRKGNGSFAGWKLKEAAQLPGPGKDGNSTSSACGRDHEADSGPIIGHTVAAFLWGKNMKLRVVLLTETLPDCSTLREGNKSRNLKIYCFRES